MSACQENNTKVVKELLRSKPDLNLTNQQVHLAHSCALLNEATLILSVLPRHSYKKQCRLFDCMCVYSCQDLNGECAAALLAYDAGLAGLHCAAHCLQGRTHRPGQDSPITQCRP